MAGNDIGNSLNVTWIVENGIWMAENLEDFIVPLDRTDFL